MSARIRGEEISVRFRVNGKPVGTNSSWYKVRELTVTPDGEIKRTGFLGESTDDPDHQFHIWKVAATLQNLDAVFVDLADEIVRRQEAHDPPIDVEMQTLYAYRDGKTKNRLVSYSDGVLRITDEGFRERKEYVETKLEAEFRQRETITIG